MAGNNFWGELVRQLRIEQGITQRRLALVARVNRMTLRRIEAGDTSADIDIMERLLAYLGCELDVMTSESLAERARRRFAASENPSKRSAAAAQRVLLLNLSCTGRSPS